MALYTLNVPDPPPGQDWSTTVPGQYLYNVTGITAELVTRDGTIGYDATGHGNDLPYAFTPAANRPLMQGWPGVLTGDTAQRMQSLNGVTHYGDAGRHTPSTMDWSAGFTIEWWSQATAGGPDADFFDWSTTPTLFHTILVSANGQVELIFDNGADLIAPVGSFLWDGNWHQYVWSVTPGIRAGTAFYVDGADAGPVGLIGPFVALPAADNNWRFNTSAPPMPGATDELAFYPYALSPAQVAAHFAAAPIFADYTAAVLADLPAAYYHLDEKPGATGRQPFLAITDGTNGVELIPTGFAAPLTGLVFAYSWQPGLGNRSQTPGGATTSVPVPPLIIPAGYTVGTVTPDLQPSDQWTNIVVWWNSDKQDLASPPTPFVFAPSVHLVYHQQPPGG